MKFRLKKFLILQTFEKHTKTIQMVSSHLWGGFISTLTQNSSSTR